MSNPTLLTILLAVGVVVLTTFGNTLLESYKERIAHKRQREILRVTLIAELTQARESVESNIARTDEPEPDGSFAIPISSRKRVYEANIGNLGRLSAAQVAAVVKAYSMLEGQIETVSMIGSIRKTDGPVVLAVVSSQFANVLSVQNRAIYKALTEAIEALSQDR